MNQHVTTRISQVAITAGLIGLFTMTAEGASVSINQTPIPSGTSSGIARLRASNNSWDVGVSNGVSWSPRNSRSVGFHHTFVAPGRSYTFNLQYRAGEGYIFSVRDSASGRQSVQAWGVFSAPPGTQNVVATLGGISANRSFNALKLDARATSDGARTSFSNLVFAGEGLDVSGDFFNTALNQDTLTGTGPAGTACQCLLADVDLSGYTWSLSGTVELNRGWFSNNSDDVSFAINMMNTTFAAPLLGAPVMIPEPAGTALLSAAVAGLLLRRRRTARV